MYLNRNKKLTFLSYGILFFGSIALRIWDRYAVDLPFRPIAISFLAYCAICILFIALIKQNVPYIYVRRFLITIAVLLLLWKSDELIMQNLYPISSWQTRFLWYLQYIPILLIPNATLLSVLHAGTRFREKIPRRWYGTFLISGLLLACVLTNDAHRKVFSFPSGLSSAVAHYHYGPLYWIVMLWVFFLFGLSIYKIHRHIRVRELRRNTLHLVATLGIGLFYLFRNVFGKHSINPYNGFGGDLEIWTFILLFSVELVMWLGLIRANFNSQELFEASTISAQLEDASGVRYQTQNLIPSTAEQKEQAMSGEVYLDVDHRLHGRDIGGGRMFWVEDVGAVNRAARQLEETAKALEQENDLIQAENRMIARTAKAEEQSRLYEVLARQVQPQMNRIEEILESTSPEDPAFREKLARACLYKVYGKRLSNMALLAQESHTLDLFELQSALRETLDYLNIQPGVHASGSTVGEGRFRAAVLMQLYELCQRVLEDSIESLRELEGRLTAKEGMLSLSMTLSGPGICLKEKDYEDVRLEIVSAGGTFSLQNESDRVYLDVKNLAGGGKLG